MAILSFQGYYGGVTFPFKGPVEPRLVAVDLREPGRRPVHAGAERSAPPARARSELSASRRARVVAFLAFTLSMAFRRRFRGDGIAFYVIMLALMAPGFLLGLGTQLFWKAMGDDTSLWHTALGANTVWGIPFGFLVMVAIWNRYDDHIDEAARDLGANAARTFAEVTLPLVWTGIFGALPVRLHADLERLRPHGAARDRRSDAAARDRRPDPELGAPPRSLRARHGDDARLAGADRRCCWSS